jgi:hypothetical protein
MSEPIKYDPDHMEYDSAWFGYKGPFPKTPCRKCGGEYFTWVGDWNMGYWCVECRTVWKKA